MMTIFRKTLGAISILAFLVASVCTAGYGANTVQAKPTMSAVLINGTQVSFQAYNIGDYNYFKLRDLAKALSGSAKQFEVTYDGANSAISITTGKAYTPVGGELTSTGDASTRNALVSKDSAAIDGVKVALSAYLIDGYNYYKLRDIAAAVGFGVIYDGSVNNINIDTSAGYTDDKGASSTPEDPAVSPASNPLVGAWRINLPAQDPAVPSYLYLIFTDNGKVTQFIGSKVATYTADDHSISVTKVKVMTSDTYGYKITGADGQTTLTIDSNQFGAMVRDGVAPDGGPGSIPGLWLSKNGIYNSDTYFYFTKDGSILLGVTMNGTYSVSSSGDSYTHNITQNGAPATSAFRITVNDGTTKLITTDNTGSQTVMDKD